MWDEQAGEMNGRLEVDGDLLARAREVDGREPDVSVLDTRIVDEHVEAREFADCPVEERQAIGRSLDVADADRDLRMSRFRVAELVLSTAADDHVAARAEKPLRERKADA